MVFFALVASLGVYVPLMQPPTPVYADNNLEQLCVPQRNPIDGNYFEPTGWLQVAFINRATIKVQFVGEESCRTPNTVKLPFIHSNGKKFEELAGGTYYDPNTNHDYDYRRQVGEGSRDDSRVDQFSGNGPDDPFGGKDTIISDDMVRSIIGPSEFSFGIEEDAIGSNVTCTSDNRNFTINPEDDSWRCVKEVSQGRGYRIRNKFSGLANFNITYNYQEGKIVHVSRDVRGSRTFSWCEGAQQFRSNDCSGPLHISGSVTQKDLEDLDTGTGTFTIKDDNSSTSFNVIVAGSASASAGATPPPGADESGGSGPSCESEGGAVAWILCPVIEGLVSALDSITKGPLEDLLRYDSLTNNTADNPIYDVWRNFVRIANILFIFAFMLIIFSQALSINIDAYSIRKMLPRVVIGIILVQLSYFMMAFAVDIFNVLGAGVAGLILGPIQGMPTVQTLIAPIIDDNAGGAAATNVLGTGLIVANAAAIGGAAVGLIWALIALLPTILFIILAVVVTLILRKALIAACIVFAPIALVAWILPNTQGVFKQWGEVFFKSLMMFPLIMALLAIGKFAGALIVADGEIQNGSGDGFNTVASLIVNVAPYAAIVLAYKWSGRLLRGFGSLLFKARGFRGVGAAAGGAGGGRGGGGGAGAAGASGGYRGKLAAARATWAAGHGQNRFTRSKVAQMFSQRPKEWTINPLRGVRLGQLKNIKRDPTGALKGAFGGATPVAQWQRQREAAGGAAEEQFNNMKLAAAKQLEAAGLNDDQKAMEAIRLGKRGVAMLRAKGRGAKADEVDKLQQKYAQFMRPEHQIVAAETSLAASPEPDITSPIPIGDSDLMVAYQAIADMFGTSNEGKARAGNEIKKLTLAASKNGRHLQGSFAYDASDGKVKMDAGKDPVTRRQMYTMDRKVAMKQHVINTSANDLVGTHFSAVPDVAASIRDNLMTGVAPGSGFSVPEVRIRTARQLGELLASDRLDLGFRREVEDIYGSLTPGSTLHNEVTQTARNLGATI